MPGYLVAGTAFACSINMTDHTLILVLPMGNANGNFLGKNAGIFGGHTFACSLYHSVVFLADRLLWHEGSVDSIKHHTIISGPLLTWHTRHSSVEQLNCRLLETILQHCCLCFVRVPSLDNTAMLCLTAVGLTQPVETRDCRIPIPFASSHWGSPVSRLGMAHLQGV